MNPQWPEEEREEPRTGGLDPDAIADPARGTEMELRAAEMVSAGQRSQDVLSELTALPKEADRADLARALANTAAEIKRRAAPSLRKHGISKAFLFGSTARGDVHSHSDLDIAVELPEGSDMDLIGFVGLGLELEARLGRRVDLVNLATMKPRIRERAEREKVLLL